MWRALGPLALLALVSPGTASTYLTATLDFTEKLNDTQELEMTELFCAAVTSGMSLSEDQSTTLNCTISLLDAGTSDSPSTSTSSPSSSPNSGSSSPSTSTSSPSTSTSSPSTSSPSTSTSGPVISRRRLLAKVFTYKLEARSSISSQFPIADASLVATAIIVPARLGVSSNLEVLVSTGQPTPSTNTGTVKDGDAGSASAVYWAVPVAIVAIILIVVVVMYCKRPKIKHNERPVFDGFEMGDAQQLESSSANIEFAVPEFDFDERAHVEHRETIG